MKTTMSRIWRAAFSGRIADGSGLLNNTNGAETSIRARLRTLLISEEEGTQLVEIAFVAPIFLILLTGLASFSMALYSYQQLGYATSAAAQQIGAEQGLITDPCAQLVSDITTSLPNWNPAKFTYSEVITNSAGKPISFSAATGSSFTCTAGAGDMTQNEPMTVTVSYQFSWFAIMTWKPTNSTFTPSGNLSVTEAVLVE